MLYYTLYFFSLALLANQTTFNQFKWIGNAMLMTAAGVVAVSAEWATQAWPFVLYTLGAGVWMYAGMVMKDKALFSLNLFFVLLDVYAVWIRI